MKKKLDQISRNRSEDICLSLWDVHRAPLLELRVHRRAAHPGHESHPGIEGIAVPVEVLPDLVRMLQQTQERLIRQGLLNLPSSAGEATTMEAGEAVRLGIRVPVGRPGNSRREARVTLDARVGCHVLDGGDSCPAQPLIGEIKDVSQGGAQLRLPTRLPLFSRVEVFMRIAERNFQGRAEVVAAGVESKGGRYRHSIRWMVLNSEAETALLKLIPSQ